MKKMREAEMVFEGEVYLTGGVEYEVQSILEVRDIDEGEFVLAEAVDVDDGNTVYLAILSGEVDHVEENRKAAYEWFESYVKDSVEFSGKYNEVLSSAKNVQSKRKAKSDDNGGALRAYTNDELIKNLDKQLIGNGGNSRAVIMLDTSTGEVWADEFYDHEENNWKNYHDEDIVAVGEATNWYVEDDDYGVDDDDYDDEDGDYDEEDGEKEIGFSIDLNDYDDYDGRPSDDNIISSVYENYYDVDVLLEKIAEKYLNNGEINASRKAKSGRRPDTKKDDVDPVTKNGLKRVVYYRLVERDGKWFGSLEWIDAEKEVDLIDTDNFDNGVGWKPAELLAYVLKENLNVECSWKGDRLTTIGWDSERRNGKNEKEVYEVAYMLFDGDEQVGWEVDWVAPDAKYVVQVKVWNDGSGFSSTTDVDPDYDPMDDSPNDGVDYKYIYNDGSTAWWSDLNEGEE